jgi:hypothetical protein
MIGSDKARKDVRRMYYTSIAENRLFSMGGVKSQGTLIGEAWTDSRDTAVRYISALEQLRAGARTPRAQ